ncbi:MAG: pilus assembly protein TadG-related protein [Acidimicrobiales bacterium]
MTSTRTTRADERGTILILSTVGIVVAMIAAALAVDLGRLASDKRDDQKVADLAALDAARDLSSAATACGRAQLSATRNGFSGLSCSNVEMGSVSGAGVFTPDGTLNSAVRVTVRSSFSTAFPFVSGPSSTGGKAVAKVRTRAGFSIGSSLANFSSADNVVLNKVLGAMLGGSLNLSTVSYQGLAGASVKLGDLATQLTGGSVDTLLTTNLTLGQLLTATATVLSSSSPTVAATVSGLATVAATSTTTFKLGDLISATQGLGSVAGADVNVLDLVTAAAQVANKNHLVDAGTSLSLPVTGVGSLSTTVAVTVIEPPKIYFGDVGGSVSTAQVTEKLASTLSANALGLGLLTISGVVPVSMAAAGATGTLTAVNCTAPSISVGVTSQPVTTSTGTTLTVSLLGIPVASVKVGPASANSASGSSSLTFSYPSEFSPSASPKSTTAVAPGLTVSTGNISVTLLGSLPLGITVSDVASAVQTIVNNVVSAASNEVLTPTFAAMGLKLGQDDVGALKNYFDATSCGQPGLVG